jgi:DNA replication protein DnaC
VGTAGLPTGLRVSRRDSGSPSEHGTTRVPPLARFPALKTLEACDFTFPPTLDETHVRTLGDLSFLDRTENVLLVGPPGVGKTHLAVALGVRACAARKRVQF